MKFKFLFLVTLTVFVSGCGSSQMCRRRVWGESLLTPIPQSAFPADPVRRRYRESSNLDGSYHYYHSQGTDNYGVKYWDPYTGRPVTEMQQRTYSYTSESRQPVYWYPPTYDGRGPSSSDIEGHIRLQPNFKQGKK